ncbi:MAG: hypothetical protein R2806_12055 [Saprospiraceae bacterium]
MRSQMDLLTYSRRKMISAPSHIPVISANTKAMNASRMTEIPPGTVALIKPSNQDNSVRAGTDGC